MGRYRIGLRLGPFGTTTSTKEAAMAHGYWVVFADVTDPEGYKEYIAANGKALAKFGASFLARGGKVESKEGQPKSLVIVVEFPNYAAALECYHSPEYASAMKLRDGRAV